MAFTMTRSLTTVLGLCLFGSAGDALAQSNALDFTGVTGGYRDGVPRVIGWEFTTGAQPLLVANLGVYDHQQNGLVTSHAVGIYRSDTQALVVSGSVPSGTSASLSSFFRYTPVAPTVLDADTRYVVAAAWQQNADEFIWTPAGGTADASAINFTTDPAITLGLTGTGLPASARYEDTTAVLEFPDLRIGDVFPGDGRIAFIGPNFTVSPVPEPAAVLAIATGLLLAARRCGRVFSRPDTRAGSAHSRECSGPAPVFTR